MSTKCQGVRRSASYLHPQGKYASRLVIGHACEILYLVDGASSEEIHNAIIGDLAYSLHLKNSKIIASAREVCTIRSSSRQMLRELLSNRSLQVIT